MTRGCLGQITKEPAANGRTTSSMRMAALPAWWEGLVEDCRRHNHDISAWRVEERVEIMGMPVLMMVFSWTWP